ncbi:hypothetical protein [Streptomyces akebiae]|uniref:ATP-binding protein n=1 Tax=Streptomyces akebiae TaxID=2865673 RepID=A0ABX8XRH4_9ACTN|nr:hypothetical protein [Streptomyces akebiae]QYX78209.1 hypothetical protein K1J60_18110 [Streptomyces akebiae]
MTTATTPAPALFDISRAYEHSPEPPFVVLAGARGLGRSTVLRELCAAYRGRGPVALVDGEESRFDRPPPGRPPTSWSPAYEAVTVVAEQLAEPLGGAGRITFPRLACGLLAVAAGGWGDRGLSRICAEAERILLLSDTGGWLAGRWVGKAVARLVSSMSDQGPVVEATVEAALEAFSEGMSSSHRRLRRGAVWYRDHPCAAGNPKLGLVLLCRHAGLRGQGHPALRNAARRTLAEVTRGADWAPGGTPSSHALLVSLPPLSPDDTRDALEAACPGLTVPPRLPSAVHRLTGGNPLGTALLATSAGRNLPRGLTTPADLLLAEHSGRRAYEAVLDRLLPDEDHLDELAVLSLAHDHASALVLAESQLPVGFGESSVRALSSRLAAEGHAPSPDHFVGDPFLRALLLLRLRHGESGRAHRDRRGSRAPAWRDAHRALASHYGSARPLHRAHHELALGKPDFAVDHLHDTYDSVAPRDWLAALTFLTSAPHHTPDDTRIPTALDATGTTPDLRLRVRRVLHAARRTTDPFSPPTPETTEHLHRALASLLPASAR